MSPKRGDQVPQPTQGAEWELRFDTTPAAKCWQDLESAAAGNLRKAWDTMRHSPDRSTDPQRHTRLKGGLATVTRKGIDLPQWQIEVIGGGRIWYRSRQLQLDPELGTRPGGRRDPGVGRRSSRDEAGAGSARPGGAASRCTGRRCR